jgi:hypothetical protein
LIVLTISVFQRQSYGDEEHGAKALRNPLVTHVLCGW